MLKETKLAPDFPMEQLASLTEGFSGSDLRESCRKAAMVPVRQYVRSASVNQEMLEKGQVEVCILSNRVIASIDHCCRVSTLDH